METNSILIVLAVVKANTNDNYTQRIAQIFLYLVQTINIFNIDVTNILM